MRKIFPFAAALACSCALATLAAPTQITACTTIAVPGSYILANNLSSFGDCIVIATSYVTLDLNGFAMEGLGKGGSAVTEQPGNSFHAITVRNGNIVRYARAILLAKSVAVTVERITAMDNTSDAVTTGDDSIVRDSAMQSNGGNGLRMGMRALVRGNTVSMNGGIGVSAGMGAQIVDNTIGHNKASGIVADEGANVVHNVSRNNGADGIFVECPSAVVGNAATNNLGQNLDLLGGACETGHNSAL